MAPRKFSFFGVFIAAAMLSPAIAADATLNDVSPPLRKQAECMFHSLEQVRSIDQVKLVVSHRFHWIHPYLDYRAAADKTGYRLIVRIEPMRACSKNEVVNCCQATGDDFCFMTDLPGLTAPGTMVNDWGASALSDKLKAECGVDVSVLFN